MLTSNQVHSVPSVACYLLPSLCFASMSVLCWERVREAINQEARVWMDTEQQQFSRDLLGPVPCARGREGRRKP